MNRTAEILAAFMLTFAPWLLSQEAQRNLQVPEDALSTRQLIAWSGLQKPQPAPQPLPPRDTPIPQPDQPSDRQATSPSDPHTEQIPTTQSFTGKIVKDNDKYALKVGTKTYRLEGQDGLQEYENQTVRVIGKIDAGSDTIRVVRIELVS